MLPSSAASGVETKLNPAPEIPWGHITTASPAGWVDLPAYSRDIAAKEGAHLTFLLWERQVNAEAFTSFHATAKRLETSLAVQHESQFQLNLDPRNHRLVLHWLRIIRGEQTFDALDRSRMRLIQRETQLEHLVIDGQWTLLMILDDVRPGDIIEAAYSYIGAHPIRPKGTEGLFVVPPQIVIGRYRLRVEFDATRPSMAWKTSTDMPPPNEENFSDNRRRWTWEGAQTSLRDPEPNQPSTFMDYSWIQFSDLAEWSTLTALLVEAWEKEGDSAGLESIPAFARPPEVNEQSVQKLIQHIQDEFRYLSVDLESGGWIPASPAKVARRRYGDCKDLAWLASCILRQWGVNARPILVGTGLRETVGKILPMTLLFNHAVVEVSLNSNTRWFDLTLRRQGGSFDTQPVSWFEFGLPVDREARELSPQPGSRHLHLYLVRETFFLDTRPGKPSALEVRVRTEGWHAENLRRNRLAQGVTEFEADRLKLVQRRHAKATRTGSLQWRDNREANSCELVETFELQDATYTDERGERALFDVPPNLALQSLDIPDDKPRRAPWDMPYLIELRHEIAIRAPGMSSGKRRKRRWSTEDFVGTLDEPRYDGVWSKVIRFKSNSTEIPPDRLPAYRRELDGFLQATTWRLYLPKNLIRPIQDDRWGQLPPPGEGATAYVPAVDPADFPDAKNDPDNLDGEPIVHSGSGSYSQDSGSNYSSFLTIGIPVLLALGALARCSSNLTEPPKINYAQPPGLSSQRFERSMDTQLAPREGEFGSFSRSGEFGSFSRNDSIFARDLAARNYVEKARQSGDHSGPERTPQIQHSVQPIFPVSLLGTGKESTVIVEFVVDEEGDVQDARIIQTDHPLLVGPTLTAIKQWKFLPGMKDGVNVKTRMQVPVVFASDKTKSSLDGSR